MKESSRIWNELVMAKQYTLCIAKYTSRQRKINRYVDLCVVVFIIATIALFPFFNWCPILGASIGLIWKYATHILPLFKQDEKDLAVLDDLHTFYESYYNRLEHLWYLLINAKLSEEVLMSLFFREKESEANKKATLNRLQQGLNKLDIEETQREAEEYINQVFKYYERDEEPIQ